MQKLQVTLWTVASAGMIGSRSTLRLKVMAGSSSQHVRQAAIDQLVDAGRVHAAYGTDGFPHPLPGVTPEKVVAAVGARSERLIDLYLGPLKDEGRALVELRRVATRWPDSPEGKGALQAIANIKNP